MAEPKTTIPKGSWILVTGMTGFIAAHITRELLTRGYKVRGTVRSVPQASWLTDEVFASYHASHDLELVSVGDMAAPKAFDAAIKGMSAVVHVATIQSFDSDPKNVIDPTVQGLQSLLDAANRELSVSRFVYTSSVGAAIMLAPGATGHVTRDTWNEVAVRLSLTLPPDDRMRGPMNYMASKVIAEKALWSFVDEAKPSFSVNVVSPATAIGTVLNQKHLKTSPGWVDQLWRGETSKVAPIRACECPVAFSNNEL